MVKARQFVVSPIDDKMRQISARVVVDIAKPGVSLLHPESEKKIQFYPFTHIQSWLSSKQAFGLQVLDNKQEVQTLWFRTKESENIIQALKGCVDEILLDRRKSATSKKIAEGVIHQFLEKSASERSSDLRMIVAEATSDEDLDKQRSAVWTLSLLTGVSDTCKAEILSAGHLEATLVLVRSQDPKPQCHLAGMIANCAQLDELRLPICEMGAVRPLITLAQSGVPEVARVAVAALAIISANTTVREDLAKRGTMQLFASMMNAMTTHCCSAVLLQASLRWLVTSASMICWLARAQLNHLWHWPRLCVMCLVRLQSCYQLRCQKQCLCSRSRMKRSLI